VAVRERREVEGFGAWTVKAGLPHAAPPWAVLERMVGLRVHLDPVRPENAPLLVAPGSHRLGRVPVDEVAAAAERCGTAVCEAEAGDVWLYPTPILHASKAATVPATPREPRAIWGESRARASGGGFRRAACGYELLAEAGTADAVA